ncbi:plasma-membrane proton-efflux P-type ATPase [Ruficoccus amylovorans]|uniref:Plasma-membrane proton-efflux P-type ATPase n=1 Tax=Ruficoccus amylovorans TaxID=1804625 RepID=A0A842HB34_9BACT|nr:plasma-membrane proton-efflux P-type ATPase [Ruficoccus amylovorans]MBC2593683.1 plasma-membrane proton-efflux P-type ATPase [Ruficoccus amylovorans]
MVEVVDAKQAEPMSVQELFQKLQSSPEGLSSQEAAQRLQTNGPNELTVEKNSRWKMLFGYFWGPIPWMIEIAAVLSVINRDWMDFIIILALLLINAGIGFWQEYKASDALDALKAQLALKARVRRDGAWKEIPARELVPGDVIRIRLGDVVPADTKLIEGEYLSIDQAALTGESLPVSKKIGQIAYSGSIAKQGEMVGLVNATAGQTFFAKTAKLVETAGAVSHFQKAVLHIGNFLIVVALVLCVLLVAVQLHRGDHFLDVLQFVLILAVASIPVAMPAVLSVTMALGALALSRQKAIVSRLQAIEEMAGIDILCSDKTGTLTQNKITLGEPVLYAAKDAQELILAGALASKEENNDAIDLAVFAGLADRSALSAYKLVNFTPFDPVSKRTEATVTCDGNPAASTPSAAPATGAQLAFTKGAPQVIFDLCALDTPTRQKAEADVLAYAQKGYRTLGVARQSGGQWSFLGILSLFDPPREDSAQTIADARARGIEVKMVTGDNAAIAAEISGQLGMGTHIVPAGKFFQDGADMAHSSPDTGAAIERAEGFAEVFPEHKYGIVKALQDRGHLVGMTGDGVNDAPALKQADVGIAVSGATDAARGAAALILTQPGLSVIIKAVELSRQIFERMMSYTIYRIAMTIDIMFFVVLSMLFFPVVAGQHFYPLTPIMIILLALLDDIPIMTIAYDNTRIDPKPVRWNMPRVIAVSSALGAFSVVQTFGLQWLGMDYFGLSNDPKHLQTMLFLQLVVAGHLLLFLTRTDKPFFRPPLPSWQLLGAIVATQVVAVLICAFGLGLMPPLPWKWIGLVWLYNLAWMIGLDIFKVQLHRMIEARAKFHSKATDMVNRSLGPDYTRGK